MKKIVLIGGAGFIGHNLAIYLKSKGHNVTIIDSLSVNNLINFNDSDIENKSLYRSILNNRINIIEKNDIKLLVEDARNYHQLSKAISQLKPDVIVHLAAVSHANRSNKTPHDTFDHSLRTLENVLDFCKDQNCRLVYLSSSMVYGDFDGKTVDEETICKPKGIYGSLKYAGEIIVKSYAEVFGLDYTIIRPSALYGERCVSRRVGQTFIENVIQGKEIIINGDGNEKLDFTYIIDLVDGIERSCVSEYAKNQTFNITFGQGRKINDLIEILRSEFKDIKVNYKERDNLMPERGTLSNKKSINLLGYKSNYPIEKGYLEYIKWYKKFWNELKIF
jgi:nucleoside-diphosphate-sugar epimerase